MYKNCLFIVLLFAQKTNITAQAIFQELHCNKWSEMTELHKALNKNNFIHFISTINPKDSSWFEILDRNTDINKTLYVWHKIDFQTLWHSQMSYLNYKNEIEALKQKIIVDNYNIQYLPFEGGVTYFYIHPPFTPYYIEKLNNAIYWKKIRNYQEFKSNKYGWFTNECADFFVLGNPIIPNDSLTWIDKVGGCSSITESTWNKRYSKRQVPLLLVRPESLFWFRGYNEPEGFGVNFSEKQWNKLRSTDSLGVDPIIWSDPLYAYFNIPNLEFGEWILSDDLICGESIPISYAQMQEWDPNFSKHKVLLEKLYFSKLPSLAMPVPVGNNKVFDDDKVDIEELVTESTETIDVIERIEETGRDNSEVFNFMNIESKPIWPGCESLNNEDEWNCFNLGIRQFVSTLFEYPEMAKQMGIQGKVWVSFIIEKDGKVSEITIVHGVDKLLDDEAIRVVKLLPIMIPAKVEGKPVRMRYSLPINAKLN